MNSPQRIDFANLAHFTNAANVGRICARRSVPAAPFALTASTLLTALILMGGAGDVHAQTLYVEGTGAQFGVLNANTGTYNSIGSTHIGTSATATLLIGLGYAANGALYGLGTSTTTGARLYQVNPQTASLTLVGTVTAFARTAGVSYNIGFSSTSDGTLYGYFSNNSSSTPPNLYTIDPTAASSALIGSLGVVDNGGFSGNGVGGLFIAGGNIDNSFNSVSRTTGAATQINANAGYGNASALGYSSASGSLYALSTSGGIYTVNTATGTATSTGATYDTGVVGTAFAAASAPTSAAAAPEPGSVAFLSLAGLPATGMIFARRRRKATTAANA